MMKFWLLSQSRLTGYDTYDSVVVAAETEEAARATPPDAYCQPSDGRFSCWPSPEHVVVEFLGEAPYGREAGVICASFNAG